MKKNYLIKLILFFSLLLTSLSSYSYSTVTDSTGHVAPIWRGNKNIQATIGAILPGTYQFGELIRDTTGQLIETEYIPHFHLARSTPRFRCDKNGTYRGVISPEGIGVVLGEKDGYAIIKSDLPGIGYRLDIGALISGNYTNPKIQSWVPVSSFGASNIDIPCLSGSEFTMSIKVTLVRTNENIEDDRAVNYHPINVSTPFPSSLQIYDNQNNLVLVGEFTQVLKKTSNVAVKYMKESCRYQFNNKEHLLNLGKVGSGEFRGIGSTAYGDNGHKKVDITIDCNNSLFIRNIRASIFESEEITPASQELRRQGVLMNNLKDQNAAKGIGVQVLIDNKVKPLGNDSYAYVDDDTQWDLVGYSNQALRGIYTFSVTGRYYQVDEEIREGKIQTTMGFTIIYR
ncbi:fimbrial protein [Proteus hauseri]|uniref:fimbrial protein n=1 Tax=Proteus hauseri TaxID=183417 RepID=UPI0032DBCFA5